MEVLGGSSHSLSQPAISALQQQQTPQHRRPDAGHVVHEVHAQQHATASQQHPPNNFALSQQQRRRPQTALTLGEAQQERPSSAPAASRHAKHSSACRLCARQFGTLSLYDRSHEYLGPKVLRQWERSILSSSHTPEEYLHQGEGLGLRLRNNLARWLKKNPVNREPPFVKGQAGVVHTHQELQLPQTIFRYLYDNGTIDFITIRQAGLQNQVLWGKQVRPGLTSWGPRPSEVEIAHWLPIFLEGIRETKEPYRFLAIRGTESLINEAGPQLHLVAADCVPPLKKLPAVPAVPLEPYRVRAVLAKRGPLEAECAKQQYSWALDCREPTVVAVALEVIHMALQTDISVAQVWIYHLWQWAQIFNLFSQRKYTVNMGYNTRELASVRQLVVDVLLLLEEHGGEHATAIIRRYIRGMDPAVTTASQERRTVKEREKPGFKAWQPFTLF